MPIHTLAPGGDIESRAQNSRRDGAHNCCIF